MKVYFTLLFLCFSLYLSAQTFLGPTIGYDFATLNTPRIFNEGVLTSDGQTYEVIPLLIERSDRDSGAGLKTIVIGFQFYRMLSKQWSLGIRGNYSQKEYITRIDPVVFIPFNPPIYGIYYHQFGSSVLFSRKIKDKLSIGAGPNISYFSGWNSVIDRHRSPEIIFIPYTVAKRSYGLDLQIGYHLGPVYLAVDYTRTLKIVDSSGYMKGAANLAISGTYFFELRKRK